MATILFLGANPVGQRTLAIGQEAERIRHELALAGRQGDLRIEHRLAATFEELQRAVLDVHPEYVHISSHGVGGDLLFANTVGEVSTVRRKAAARVLNRVASLKGALLMACESLPLAEALERPFSVGMAEPISDKASLAYSTSFYIGLARGEDPARCHEMGIDAIINTGFDEEEIPRFKPGRPSATLVAPTPASVTLSPGDIEAVVMVALQHTCDRRLLLMGLPNELTVRLPIKNTPYDQLRSDVAALAAMPLPAGATTAPVAIWLQNVARDVKVFPSAVETVAPLLARFTA